MCVFLPVSVLIGSPAQVNEIVEETLFNLIHSPLICGLCHRAALITALMEWWIGGSDA